MKRWPETLPAYRRQGVTKRHGTALVCEPDPVETIIPNNGRVYVNFGPIKPQDGPTIAETLARYNIQCKPDYWIGR